VKVITWIEYNKCMEIQEIILYVAMGFLPTLLAMEASWRLAKSRLGSAKAVSKVAEFGVC
jgi:hypothetical protein